MIRSIFITLAVFSAMGAVADGTANSVTASATPSGVRLPTCVNSASQVGDVSATVKANGKTPHKYDAYRKFLASDSPQEMEARLVYSEAAAANCPAERSKLIPLIATAVGNRVRIRKGDVASVVYQRDQFASSLNVYEESRFKEFLCPSDHALWALALDSVKSASTKGLLAEDTVNYFLYKHSPRWTKAPWVYPEDTSPAEQAVQACVKFFHNPAWR